MWGRHFGAPCSHDEETVRVQCCSAYSNSSEHRALFNLPAALASPHPRSFLWRFTGVPAQNVPGLRAACRRKHRGRQLTSGAPLVGRAGGLTRALVISPSLSSVIHPAVPRAQLLHLRSPDSRVLTRGGRQTPADIPFPGLAPEAGGEEQRAGRGGLPHHHPRSRGAPPLPLRPQQVSPCPAELRGRHRCPLPAFSSSLPFPEHKAEATAPSPGRRGGRRPAGAGARHGWPGRGGEGVEGWGTRGPAAAGRRGPPAGSRLPALTLPAERLRGYFCPVFSLEVFEREGRTPCAQ